MRPLAPICKFAAFPTLTFCQQVRRDTAPIALGGLAKVQNSSPPGIAAKCMDHGQPWNSPKNAAFLDSLHAGDFIHCPSSGKNFDNPLTDYVAVVGRDTLWPGKVPSDPKKHPRGILVVEWPDSDIHWAEPRDITVEEFLDWFRTKPPRRGFLDWLLARRQEHDSFHPDGLLYVDAQGSVGELRNDTDVETVRKLLTGQSTAANISPAVSAGRNAQTPARFPLFFLVFPFFLPD